MSAFLFLLVAIAYLYFQGCGPIHTPDLFHSVLPIQCAKKCWLSRQQYNNDEAALGVGHRVSVYNRS